MCIDASIAMRRIDTFTTSQSNTHTSHLFIYSEASLYGNENKTNYTKKTIYTRILIWMIFFLRLLRFYVYMLWLCTCHKLNNNTFFHSLLLVCTKLGVQIQLLDKLRSSSTRVSQFIRNKLKFNYNFWFIKWFIRLWLFSIFKFLLSNHSIAESFERKIKNNVC